MEVVSLRIAEWNANGLSNHKLELIQFLYDNNIDVLLASETHFTDRTVLKIPQYSLYHSNHPDGTAHGGAAIIIRTSLQHFEAPAYQTDKIQASILRNTDRPWPLHIAALYSPPLRHRIDVVDYDTFLRHLGLRFIVGGDWSAKHNDWGSRLTTTKVEICYSP